MNMIKNFFIKQSTGFYLTACAALCAFLSIIGYSVMIGDLMGTSGLVFAMLIIGLILQVAALVSAQFKITGRFLSYGFFFCAALFGIALVALLINRMPWFMSIASLNDVPPLHGSFFFAVIMIAITLIVSIAAAFFRIKKEEA